MTKNEFQPKKITQELHLQIRAVAPPLVPKNHILVLFITRTKTVFPCIYNNL